MKKKHVIEYTEEIDVFSDKSDQQLIRFKESLFYALALTEVEMEKRRKKRELKQRENRNALGGPRTRFD